MKKSICFYFQVHLPSQLRRYRFFDIGNSHQYYDDFNTRNHIQKVAESCYLPANKLMLDLIKKNKNNFKISYSITGEVIEQMELYAPEALASFKELAATGCVEFICETYSHSLAFLKDEKEFEDQLKKHSALIKKHFGQKPTTVRLTGLIYSDQIGEKVAKMGFETMLTEGAKHILGWKSPNYVYTNSSNSKLKVLLRNPGFSDKISYRFSEQSSPDWPLTVEKYVTYLNSINENEEVVSLFMDYLTFGFRHSASTGIFDFLKHLPQDILKENKFEFLTPAEITKKHKPIAPLQVPYPISWSEDERDLSIWLGNDLQNDAFASLCELGEKIRFIENENSQIKRDWEKLQDSDHFYFMCTRWQEDQSGRRFRNLYTNPYDAYINYMNVLSDLILRIDSEVNKKILVLMKDNDLREKISKEIGIVYTEYPQAKIKKIMELVNESVTKGSADKIKKKTEKKNNK